MLPGTVDPKSYVRFALMLKQQNLATLFETWEHLTTVGHPRFAQWMPMSKIQAITAPDAAVHHRFARWLTQGELDFKIAGDHIHVTGPVASVERLFQTTLRNFQHTRSGQVITRVFGAWSVPESLYEHLDFVAGLSEFISSSETKYEAQFSKKGAAPSAVDPQVNPALLRSYYNVPNLTVSAPGNQQSVTAFSDFFSSAALNQFYSHFALPPQKISTKGPNCLTQNPPCDQFESDLDTQYMTSMSQGVATEFINQASQYWILEWVLEIEGLQNPPSVFSLSYGYSILDQCEIAAANCDKYGYSSQQYINRTDSELAKLGANGLTVLVSSGDDGSPGLGGATGNCPPSPGHYCPVGGCTHTDSQCQMLTFTDGTNNCFFPMGQASDACNVVLQSAAFNQTLQNFAQANANCNLNFEQDAQGMVHIYSTCPCNGLKNSTYGGLTAMGYQFTASLGLPLTPDFPVSSPFVTAVGATQFVGGAKPTGEVPASILTKALITSGGGFAWYQNQPSFQAAAVQAWVNSGQPMPPQQYFNINMRGYPDIVFNGHNYQIYFGNGTNGACPCLLTNVDGTSASSPSLAGLVSLINDQLLQAGQSPVGPLAPLLYQAYAADPTIFNDIQSGDNKCNRAYCCIFGYSSGTGWDPVSGLGSPNFQALMNYLTQAMPKKL